MGFLPFGSILSQWSSVTLSRFNFQISFKFRLNNFIFTFVGNYKLLQKCTCQSRLGMQNVKIFPEEVLLWCESPIWESNAFSKDQGLGFHWRKFNIQNQESSSTLRRILKAFHKKYNFVFIFFGVRYLGFREKIAKYLQ